MASLFTPFLALVRKDLLLHFSNRRALIMGIAAPIAIAAFFGYLFDTGRQTTGQVAAAVTDLDQSPLTQRIVATLRADSGIRLSEMDAAAALDAVSKGKLAAAIVLPNGFNDAAPAALFGIGDKPVITIHHDPSQGAALALVRGLLTQHVMEAVSQTAFGNASPGPNANLMAQLRESVTGSSGLSTTRQKDLLTLFDSLDRVQQGAASAPAIPASAARQSGGGLSLPFSTESKAATARVGQNYNSFAHSFAGMSVQFILFAGIELGTSVLLARRMGLWTRLRAAPISRGSLLGSRIASGALIALALLAAIYAAAFAFFGVRIQGSVVGFIGISLAFALLTACFGLLIAALGRTPEATRGLAIFATLLLVMLGGAWVPSFIFPPWLQTASLFVPTRWAIDGFDLMTWRGGDLKAALAPIGVTLGFALVFGAIGVWRFPTEQDGAPGS